MTSLRDMAQRREAWLSEKPQGGGDKLRGLRNGDEIFFWFGGNGDEGDRLIKIYRAHAIQTTLNGKPMTVTKYCLRQNDNEQCVFCDQGLTDMKERMAMWLYVRSVLHATLAPNTPPDKIPPQTLYQGAMYFHEQIEGFRFWDASAWRDSPWPDILKLSEMHQGLHKFQAQMSVVGDNMQRRYKLYAMPNSEGFPQNLYQQAMSELKPVKDILLADLATPVAAAPVAPQQNQAAPAAPVSAFSPFGNSQPPAATPAVSFNPFAAPTATQAPPPAPTATQAPPPAPAAEQPQVTSPSPQTESQPQEQNQQVPWENVDPNKPLQSMF